MHSQLKPDYGYAYYNLGIVLDRTGRVDEALAALRRAVDLMPDSSMVHFQLGLALEKKGHVNEAVAAYGASQLKPDDGDPYYNLGTLLFHMGRSTRRWPPIAGPST